MSHDKLIGCLELREAVDLDDNSLCWVTLEMNPSAKKENSLIIFSPTCWWRVGQSFVVHQTLLELHSETVLQRSAEQLTQMGTCFKIFKELTKKKDIQWLHTAQTFFTSFFKMEIFTGAVELKVDAWARLYVEGVNNHLFKSVWDHGASGDFD